MKKLRILCTVLVVFLSLPTAQADWQQDMRSVGMDYASPTGSDLAQADQIKPASSADSGASTSSAWQQLMGKQSTPVTNEQTIQQGVDAKAQELKIQKLQQEVDDLKKQVNEQQSQVEPTKGKKVAGAVGRYAQRFAHNLGNSGIGQNQFPAPLLPAPQLVVPQTGMPQTIQYMGGGRYVAWPNPY